MSDKMLWQRGAVELARMIRDGECTSVEVVTEHLERISEVNPVSNAIVKLLGESALAEAQAADQAVAEGCDLGPLHGVPMTVKINLDIAGQASDNAVPLFANEMASRDEPIVAFLRSAGAVIIGRTNMPDFGMRWDTDNDLYGRTLNPWDPTRACGGSSGGDAVAVAVGMAPLGIGNDYGGSLRIPSAYNGVVSLRPTPGRFASTGDDEEGRGVTVQWFATDGPIARSVDDIEVALEVMRQRHAADPLWVDATLGPRGVGRVGVVRSLLGRPLAPEIASGIDAAADALREAGYVVEDVEPPMLQEAADLWRDLAHTEVKIFLQPMVAEHGSQGALRWLDAAVAQSEMLTGPAWHSAMARRDQISKVWSEFMETYPVLIGPVDADIPWPINYDVTGDVEAAVQELRSRKVLTMAGSLLGTTALTMPVGRGASGLPSPVQVITWRFQEARALDAARAIERVAGAVTPIDPVRPA